MVVGDGELRGALEDRAAALGLSSRVHFLGARRDLGNLLSAIDVFVMPSLWEGLPLAMVLAMGAGLPVVATASRAFRRSCRTARRDCSCRRATARRWPRRLRG
jgi:glycosyltransferase involved in cell wall biosynthesis